MFKKNQTLEFSVFKHASSLVVIFSCIVFEKLLSLFRSISDEISPCDGVIGILHVISPAG